METNAEQSATPTDPSASAEPTAQSASDWVDLVLAGMGLPAPAEPSAPGEPSELETEIAEIIGGLNSAIDRAKSREDQLKIEIAELREQLKRAEEAEAPAKKAKKEESSSSTSK